MWLLTQQGDMIKCSEIRTVVYPSEKVPAEVIASNAELSWVLARGTEAECREMVATIFNNVVNGAIAIRLQQGEVADGIGT